MFMLRQAAIECIPWIQRITVPKSYPSTRSPITGVRLLIYRSFRLTVELLCVELPKHLFPKPYISEGCS